MSDQLKKIAGQALDKSLSNTWTTLDYPQVRDLLECHAKLIIEECVSLFPLTHTDEQYQRRIDKTIRKHFGIE